MRSSVFLPKSKTRKRDLSRGESGSLLANVKDQWNQLEKKGYVKKSGEIIGEIIKEGYLKKKSQHGQWHARYYILYKDLLAYYKVQGSVPALGVVPLIAFHYCTALEEKDGARWDCLVRGMNGNTHTFSLCSVDRADCQEWTSLVRKTAHDYLKSKPYLESVHLNNTAFMGKFWRQSSIMLTIAKELDQSKDGKGLKVLIKKQMQSPMMKTGLIPAKHFAQSDSDEEDESLETEIKTKTNKTKIICTPMPSGRGFTQSPDPPPLTPGNSVLMSHRVLAKNRGTLHLFGQLKIKPLSEGTLFSGIKRWQRRYFALYDEVLIHYKKKGGDPSGSIQLSAIKNVRPETRLDKNCRFIMDVESTPNVSTFLLLARTPLECQQWITYLGPEWRLKSRSDKNKEENSPRFSHSISMLPHTKSIMWTHEDSKDKESDRLSKSEARPLSIRTSFTKSPLTDHGVISPSETVPPKKLPSSDDAKVDLVEEIQPSETKKESTSDSILDRLSKISILPEVKKGKPFKTWAFLSEQGFIVDMNKPNQDFQIAAPTIPGCDEKAIFIVCDGHGPVGHKVSQFVCKNLLNTILENLDALEKSVKQTMRIIFELVNAKLIENKDINTEYSGTTCILVYIYGDKIYTCNTGDSRAVLGKRMDKWECAAIPLSNDHKPSRPDEKAKIIKKGGRVGPKRGAHGDIGSSRVWLADQDIPGLAVSRAFGDEVAGTVGVNVTPEIWERYVQPNDAFVILASDGVWEFITSEEAVDIVAEAESAEESVELLVEEAKKRWAEEDFESRDDITCQVVYFEDPPKDDEGDEEE